MEGGNDWPVYNHGGEPETTLEKWLSRLRSHLQSSSTALQFSSARIFPVTIWEEEWASGDLKQYLHFFQDGAQFSLKRLNVFFVRLWELWPADHWYMVKLTYTQNNLTFSSLHQRYQVWQFAEISNPNCLVCPTGLQGQNSICCLIYQVPSFSSVTILSSEWVFSPAWTFWTAGTGEIYWTVRSHLKTQGRYCRKSSDTQGGISWVSFFLWW